MRRLLTIDGRHPKEPAILPIVHLWLFRFYTFGLLFGSAICLGAFLFLRFFRTHDIRVNPKILCPLLIGSGLVGAKLDNALVLAMHILHGSPFRATLAEFFTSGYTYFGGLIAGILASAIYVQVNHLPWLRFSDSLYSIAPAYALGRVGCFLAGDGDYGPPSSVPWAVAFPHGFVPTLDRVHPTMLYNASWELAIFALLTWVDRRRHRPGTLLGLYLLFTATGRFLFEFLSRNPALVLHLTEAQFVSLALFLAGNTIIVFVSMKESDAPSRALGKA